MGDPSGDVAASQLPSAVSFVRDWANLLTLTGLAGGVTAIFLAIRGEYHAAMIALLWALLWVYIPDQSPGVWSVTDLLRGLPLVFSFMACAFALLMLVIRYWVIIIACPLLAAVMLISARLLGRLVWCVGHCGSIER